MAAGVHDALPLAIVRLMPLADGGEGLVDVLAQPLGASLRRNTVQGPLAGQRVDAVWGFSEQRKTAVIEMAAASGLGVVPLQKRDPRWTTTFGVGELLLAAIGAGAARIILGLGGSATNDAGAGMAEALGVRFLDGCGNPLPRGGMPLSDLARIDCKDLLPFGAEVIAAVDVQNPLTGPWGATAVYGPQKGLRPEDVVPLDRALDLFARIAARDCGSDPGRLPGAGAAGGLGAAVVLFCGGVLRPGIEIVMDALRFDDHLRQTDLVLTGEGSLDVQTLQGKAVNGVLAHARAAGVPVAAVAGMLGEGMGEAARTLGLADFDTLVNGDTSVELAMRDALALLRVRTSSLIGRHL